MKYSLLTLILLLTSHTVIAGEITDTFSTGDTLTATKMNNIKSAVNDNNSDIASINSPIAVASIGSAGSPLRATPNVSSFIDTTPGFSVYTISFTGEAYDATNFVTNVTAITPAAVCNTGASSGNLQVVCFDFEGFVINADFHFVTYKFQ